MKLIDLLPLLLEHGIKQAQKSDDSEIVAFLQEQGAPLLEQLKAAVSEADRFGEAEDRAHFVANLAARLAGQRPLSALNVTELVGTANSIAEEALRICGAIRPSSTPNPAPIVRRARRAVPPVAEHTNSYGEPVVQRVGDDVQAPESAPAAPEPAAEPSETADPPPTAASEPESTPAPVSSGGFTRV